MYFTATCSGSRNMCKIYGILSISFSVSYHQIHKWASSKYPKRDNLQSVLLTVYTQLFLSIALDTRRSGIS
jgi:hypothetical protein